MRVALVALHLAVAGGVLFAAVPAQERLFGANAHWSLPLILLIVGLLVAQVAALLAGWGVLLRRMSPAAVPSRGLIARSFFLGWLGRYVPGPTSAAGKYVVCRRQGITRGMVGAALFYDILLHLGGGVMLPILVLPLALGPQWLWLTPFAGALALLLAVLGGLPAVVRRIANIAHGFRIEGATDFDPLPPTKLVLPGLLCFGSGLFTALAFHVLAAMLTPIAAEEVGKSVLIFSTAAIAGYAVPFLPSGVGVREAVLVGMMGSYIGHAEALALAILSRAVLVLFDGGLALALALLYAIVSITGRGRPASSPEEIPANIRA